MRTRGKTLGLALPLAAPSFAGQAGTIAAMAAKPIVRPAPPQPLAKPTRYDISSGIIECSVQVTIVQGCNWNRWAGFVPI